MPSHSSCSLKPQESFRLPTKSLLLALTADEGRLDQLWRKSSKQFILFNFCAAELLDVGAYIDVKIKVRCLWS